MDFDQLAAVTETSDFLNLEPGAGFHGYRITGSIHKGADGEIYSAQDARGGRCAIKIPVGRGLGNLRRYATFRTEWELAGTLHHRHVVRFDRGPDRFIVMELLDGPDLNARMRREQRLQWPEIEKLVLDICDALAYLHQRGIVHQDLKPENIVLDPEAGAKLIDFGLAFHGDMDDPLGALDEPLGTPYYIAPEQLEGIRGHPTSDIYSLGVVLYEMLTGELPFTKSTTRRGARKRLYMEPIPPRIHRPDLPCGIQELLYLLLDRDPFSRPTAAKLSQALRSSMDWASIACVTPERSAFDRWMDHFRVWNAPRYREFMTVAPSLVRGVNILAVVNDETTFERLIEAVRKEAIRQEGTVTLVAVVPFNLPDVDRAHAEQALIRKIDHGLHILAGDGIPCRFRVKQGDPESDILEYAASRKVDLIVIAPRPSSGVRRIMGPAGLTRKIVDASPTNVLVVRR
ncbi:MAG: bifunctional serine/threonine-protein kinase/universal stress protein [Thermodesulfobacteriota bacterium]